MPELITTPPNAAPPTTPLAGNASVAPQPQAGNTTTPEPQAGEGQESISLEEAKKLRSEAANLRKRMKAYEDAEVAAQQAAMSDAQKASKRADDAEAKVKAYQTQLVTAQVKLAAQTKGIIDPDIAALAIQSSLEYGDDGMPTNLEKALTDLIKNKPYLMAPSGQQAPTTPAQTVNGQRPPTVPAMNPGRANIQSPSALPPGKIPTLDEVYRSRR